MIGGTILFQKTFYSSVVTSGKVYCRVDDAGMIYFNNDYIGVSPNWFTEVSFNISIVKGNNLLAIVATNGQHGAGLLSSIYSDSSASFTVQTDNSWTSAAGKLLLLFLYFC